MVKKNETANTNGVEVESKQPIKDMNKNNAIKENNAIREVDKSKDSVKKDTSLGKSLYEEAQKKYEKSLKDVMPIEVRLENNEVYDDAELASAYETSMLSKALDEHRLKMAPQKHPGFDGLHCIDCEDEIHVDRLKTGRIRCTDCQKHFEYVEKRRGM